jgi:hypothetical protein
VDELALLKDMVNHKPLPSASDLAPARARLMTALTEADVPAAPPRRRRLMVSAATIVGLAAAITAVVSFGGLEPVGVAPPEADAVQFLHHAADAARRLPATPPRPDQFVYTKSRYADGSLREAWLSADGTHDGLIEQDERRRQHVKAPIPGCQNGRKRVLKGDYDTGMSEPCTPSPAYRADLPTDAAGMREYLSRAPDAEPGGPKDYDSLIHFALAETYVLPQSLAALFEVVADFPGLVIDERATDGAGRPGLGLTWAQPADQNSVTLVFDPRNHALLGIAGLSIVDRGIVDAVGQRP